jgi:hypothetical protein
MRKLLLLCLFLFSLSANAQENPEVITAANVQHLQSVAQINYAEGFQIIGPGPDDHPNPEANLVIPDIDTGWFSMNEDGSLFGLVDGESFVIVNDLGEIVGIPKTFTAYYQSYTLQLVDATLHDSFPYGVYLSDGYFRVFYGGTSAYGNPGQEIVFISYDTPQSIWLDCEDNQRITTCYPWLEILGSDNNAYVMRLPSITPLEANLPIVTPYTVIPNVIEFTDTTRLPYAPAQDAEAVVRIGRIPPPYTVTSTLEGMVKLWNLETGETLYEVDNGTGQPSVFGAINNPPTHLVWRDNANESLYLLNFETGENRLIAELNGDYAQWFFLSPDASVILAVDLGFQQNVVAWDVSTGEKIDLGHYRECTRPQPDMARLSADGTTLVIGCDTGLDIWRIVH